MFKDSEATSVLTTAVLLLCNVETTVVLNLGYGEAHVDVLARLHQVFEHGIVSSANIA